MASQFNILLHSYPKLRSSTPPSSTIKIPRPELPFLLNIDNRRSSFQTRKIIIPIACSSSSSSSSSEGGNTTTHVSPCWVEYLPEQARPYVYLMRMEKPLAGTLITMPLLSIAFTTKQGSVPDVKMLALFLLVGMFNRGISNTINDILDRDVDAKVRRTASRPLPSGALTLNQGISCLGIQVLLCYGLLYLVNASSRYYWLGAMVLTFTYPLTKRVTYWPQAYCALAINSFNLCGWAAVKESLDPRILLPLSIAGFFWVVSVGTIYTHQDKEDDVNVGVKSTALLFRDSTKKWLCGFAAANIGAFTLTGCLASIGWPYYASLVAASTLLTWQISTVDLDSPADCHQKFESNVLFGAIILCGVCLGKLCH